MDTSTEYILMCEKAVEIQGIRNLESDGDVFYYETDTFFNCHDEFEQYANHSLATHKSKDGKILIWLPRQDQLQEMVIDKENHQPPISLIGKVSKYGSIPLWMDTWEQYWLSFVMKEKFNKEWNGEGWIIPQNRRDLHGD